MKQTMISMSALALALAMGLRRPMEAQPHDTQPLQTQ